MLIIASVLTLSLMGLARNPYSDLSIEQKKPKKKSTSVVLKSDEIAGSWNATLKCTRSGCPSAKLGNVLSEVWLINVEPSNLSGADQLWGIPVRVKVLGNETTNSEYSGYFKSDKKLLTLTWTKKGRSNVSVALSVVNKNQLKGLREVANSDPCTIRYNVILKRN